MSIRSLLKNILPSYRIERRINEKIEMIKKNQIEMDRKNEYLFWLSQQNEGEAMEDTKKRVFLNMPKATGRLRNIQLAENFILQRVKDICDEQGMELFLVGGTLIGAVRHHGFIPWDNDIDIGMMKHDYLKLRKLLEEDELLRVDYCYNYKAGLKTSKVKFKGNDVFFIDILVFDYIDVTEKTLDTVWKNTQKANKDHQERIKEETKHLQSTYYCRPIENHDLDVKMETFENKQLEDFPMFGHGDYFCEPINCPWWSRDERGIRLIADYYPLLKDEVEFEGRKYDVWLNYDRALFSSYGDIWNLPFSINEPHTTEFDEGLEEGFDFLRKKGIIHD